MSAKSEIEIAGWKLTELAKAGLNQRSAAKQPEKQFAE
jgi:hypothetical protein